MFTEVLENSFEEFRTVQYHRRWPAVLSSFEIHGRLSEDLCKEGPRQIANLEEKNDQLNDQIVRLSRPA